MFVDQLKNTRAALFDVALERSHWRRLVCRRALGKMQRKAMIKCKNLLGNTVTWHALSEIENETAERNSRSKIEKGFAWQIRRPRAPLSGNLLC